MKKYWLVLLAAALLATIPVTAEAQSCDSASKVTSDIWDEIDQFVKAYPCTGTVDCLIQRGALLTDTLISFWNSQADDGWGKIGPRDLEFDKNYTGTLRSTSGRMFITPVPASATPVTITIDETDGKAKTSVVVCKVDENNVRTKVATKWFNDTSERKKKKKPNEHRSVEVKGVKGDIVTVHFDAKSWTNEFSYKIRASY